MQKTFMHILVKSGSIHIKPIPKWSSAHATHIVKYISPSIGQFFDILSGFEDFFAYSLETERHFDICCLISLPKKW